MGCCGKRQFPTVKQQIVDLTVTAANVIATAAKSGQVVAEKGLIEKRVATCRACPQLQVNRCLACGCYVQAKAGLKGASCPLKKW